jgi:hypothetical protein
MFTGEVLQREDDFEGQFIINPINLKTGEGYHKHENSEGFAFTKIIIKDNNTFLVESPYTAVKENEQKQKIPSRIYQAFIWRKIINSQKND